MAEPYLTPEEAALKELAEIEALGLAARGRFKQHYTLVSETVRRYLERRYRVLAMESPTSFTVAAIREKEVTRETLDLIGSLLDETDLVKFAKFLPAEEAAGALVARSRDLVKLAGSRPSPPWATEVAEP
jgi:hypothetical protein